MAELYFRLLDMSLVAIFNLTRLLSYALPPLFLRALFKSVGCTLYYCRPSSRRRLLSILGEALPEISDRRQIEKIGRQVFCAPFLPMLDLIMLKRHGERIMSKLRVERMENLDKADAQGKGVIIITSHIGAFSIGISVTSRLGKFAPPIGFHPSATSVPRYTNTLMECAESLGCDPEVPIFFVEQDVIQKVQAHLARGKRVSIAFDVCGNYIADFLGCPTALHSGIAHFAYDTGSPVLPVYLLRCRNPLEFRLIVGETLDYSLSGDRSRDIDTMMGEILKAGENMIKEAPGQWMSWFGLSQWRQGTSSRVPD
jgi:KDO2-lipid IV(A) lauroyltransferase